MNIAQIYFSQLQTTTSTWLNLQLNTNQTWQTTPNVKEKYKDLIIKLDENFVSVKFVNLSISSLGVFDKECDTFIEMMNDLHGSR